MEETKQAAKTVSVLMLDIQGSTGLSRKLGGEGYLEMLPKFRTPVDEATKRHFGGEFQKQAELGDDCIKADFSTPLDAVACAIDIQNYFKQHSVAKDPDGKEIKLVLHLAVHTCPPASDGRPDRSEVPHLARLLTQANNGQVLLSPACYDTYKDTHGNVPVKCEKFGGYLFKGFEEAGEQSIYSLLYDAEYRGAPGTHFIGFDNLEAANEYIIREEAEKAIRDKFVQPNGQRGGKIRFVTVYGEGGMGKTRLTINTARQLVGHFPGYVAFVALAGIKNPNEEKVADAIFNALHLVRATGDIQPQLLIELKNRPATLLLLDNAETITHETAIVAYIQQLLGDVPQLCFLASSRHWFGLGMQEGRIDINTGLTPWEAYQLFEERAAERDFPFPEGVTKDEIEILHRLLNQRPDYSLPKDVPATGREHDLLCLLRLFWLANRNSLALEMIASWTGELYKTAGELVTKYEKEALGLLAEDADLPYGDQITQMRHKSLEASYRWSWKHLGMGKNGQDAQAAFIAAALFAETFTAEAMEAVLGWDDENRTLRAMKAVQDAALLRSFGTPTGTRYQMHWQLQKFGRDETYRQGSAEDESRLPALAVLRQNLIAYYDKNMEDYGDDKGIKTAEGRAWLDAEWRNVVAAAEDADKEAKLEEAVWLRLRLTRYFELTSKWGVWEAVGKKAKESAVQAGDKRNQAATLNNLGNVYQEQGKWTEAENAHNAALLLFQEFGDRRGQGQTLNNLGNVYQAQSKWTEAENAYLQDLAICEEFGDRLGQGQTLGNLAILWIKQGDFGTAAKYARDAFAVVEQTEDTRLLQWLRQMLDYCVAQGGAA